MSIGVTTYRKGELVTKFVGRAYLALYALKAKFLDRQRPAVGDKLDSMA